jgi:UDP-3-O-[3-hydroxymyristoyl] glucosamine N-acyltransferase
MKFSDIIHQLEPSLIQSYQIGVDPEITGIASLEEALADNLSYIEGEKFADQIHKTKAKALILPLKESLQNLATEKGISWIATSQPRLLFAQAINLFYQPFQPDPGIHPTAVIDPTAVIGENVYLGPFVIVEKGVKIGDRCSIYGNVVIYPQVTIGSDTILHANCTIHERSQIGSHCVIHSGAAIGSEGFGFVPTPQGWYKMQQSGYVVLEDGVEIGCNSTIDRPAVGETRIGKNTKIDNLVHIAHGCQIGENCAMAAQVGLAGGVTVGNRVILAGQVGIANQAKIGDGAIASAQTGIHGDVPPGEIVSGSPAVSNKLYLKVSAIYKRLPEMYETFKKLKKSL